MGEPMRFRLIQRVKFTIRFPSSGSLVDGLGDGHGRYLLNHPAEI